MGGDHTRDARDRTAPQPKDVAIGFPPSRREPAIAPLIDDGDDGHLKQGDDTAGHERMAFPGARTNACACAAAEVEIAAAAAAVPILAEKKLRKRR